MKNLTTLLLLVFVAIGLNAQTFTTTFSGDRDDKIFSVVQPNDGNFVMTGYSYNSTDWMELNTIIMKITPAGDTLWITDLLDEDEDMGREVIISSDSNYVVVGHDIRFEDDSYKDIFVAKLDDDGNVLWKNYYGNSGVSEFGYSIEETSDGGFVIVGETREFTSQGDICMLKISSDGTEEWYEIFRNDTQLGIGYAVLEQEDGSFVVVGTQLNGDPVTDYLREVHLLFVDELGELLSEKRYSKVGNEEGHDAVRTYDGGIAIWGYSTDYTALTSPGYIIKTDSQGDTLWTKVYDEINVTTSINSKFCQTVDGGFLFSGYINDPQLDDQLCMVKTDALGNIETIDTIGQEGHEYGLLAMQAIDGSYMAVGVDDNSYDDILFVKTTDVIDIQNNSDTVVVCGSTDEMATFVMETDAVGVTYQWQYLTPGNDWANYVDGGSISGAQTSSLTIDPVTLDNVDIDIRCYLETESAINATVPVQINEPIVVSHDICMVLVDSLDGNNAIVWEGPYAPHFSSFNIFRESEIGEYDSIGNVPAYENSVFLDLDANPAVKSYKYKLQQVDECGNGSELSDMHSTLHLIASTDVVNGGIALQWNTPVGFDFAYYIIYRGTSVLTMDSLTSYAYEEGAENAYTDLTVVPDQQYHYVISAWKPDACELYTTKRAMTGPFHQSLSNIDEYLITVTPTIENTISIMPNPMGAIGTISSTQLIESISLMDMSGKVVRYNASVNANTINIEKGNLSSGIYFLEVVAGKVYREKIIIE